MASVSLNTQMWNDKVEIVNDIYKIMKNLIEKEEWERLSKLYNGMSIDTGMGSIPFSDSKGVERWLTLQYGMPPHNEFNENKYYDLFKQLRIGGKRSTRRHRSRRHRTRRQKK